LWAYTQSWQKKTRETATVVISKLLLFHVFWAWLYLVFSPAKTQIKCTRGPIQNTSCYFLLVLVRFQNSSVPVLNLKKHSVSVSIDSNKMKAFESGSRSFGFSIPSVLVIKAKYAKNLWNFWQEIIFLSFFEAKLLYNFDFRV